ncbi:MAG TPA: glycosyltransferase, partial [Bryobacteraceae bacterium]
MNAWSIAVAAVSGGYQVTAILACLKHLLRRNSPRSFTPPVSILKPVRGADSGFYEAIRSQAQIDYPEYEILFGVREDDAPALSAIRRVQSEFPDRSVRIIRIVTDAPNGKVGALIDLQKEARFDYLVISDADIRVPKDYLTSVIGGLEDPSVGLVTCLYRTHSDTFAGTFEGLGVETDFAPSALVAPLVGVDEFAFGSTIAVRRADLIRSGGFEAVADYIADDYQIGKRIHALGLKCVLSETIVDTHLGAEGFLEAWRHQIRWARTIRVSRTGGFIGLFVTFATFWALLLGISGEWKLGLAVLVIRLIAAAIAGIGVMRSRQTARLFFLVPFRDLWAVLVWAA